MHIVPDSRTFFEFVCHLAVERCKGTHEVLRLSIFLATGFFLDMLGTCPKCLFSETEIHGPPIHIINFSNANALAQHGFRKTLTFMFKKKKPRPSAERGRNVPCLRKR